MSALGHDLHFRGLRPSPLAGTRPADLKKGLEDGEEQEEEGQEEQEGKEGQEEVAFRLGALTT